MEAFLLGVAIGAIITIARWILRPLDQAAKGRNCPAQFTLLDVLCLVFMAQLPTGLVAWMFAGSPYGGVGLVYGFSWIACGLLWWTAVRALSRAGIRHVWHRAATLAFVLPVAVFGAIAFPPLVIVVTIATFSDGILSKRVGAGLGWLILAGLVALFYACGRYTRWLVASARTEHGDGEAKTEKALQ